MSSVWMVNIDELQERLDRHDPITISWAGLSPLEASLERVEIFAPGEQKIVYVDEDQTVIREEEFAYDAYRGTVHGVGGSHVFLAIDDHGVYGRLRVAGVEAELRPMTTADDQTRGPTHVSWTNRSHNLEPNLAQLLPPPPGGEPTIQSHDNALVKPFGDAMFRGQHSDWSTRITNAFVEMQNMWASQTNINVLLSSIVAAPNFSSSTNCSDHLGAFKDNHAMTSGVDAYQLFTGRDLATCIGLGYSSQLPGFMASTRDSIVEAHDHSIFDSYDPDQIEDLAIVSAEEIAHNWGEPWHPKDCNPWWSCNVMASGTNFNIRDLWFTAGSAERIIDATAGNL